MRALQTSNHSDNDYSRALLITTILTKNILFLFRLFKGMLHLCIICILGRLYEEQPIFRV